jgi:coenzyme F420-0:L-glutamate ligase/coenzyme F420-1:gamma-L-glutamate ligase
MITIHPIVGIGEVAPGTDLTQLVGEAIHSFPSLAGDILVVTQKIVSKAENRFVRLVDVVPGTDAEHLAAITGKDPRLVELILRESSAVLRAVPNILITRHRTGHVMANAGIDRSNIGAGREGEVLLLPRDSDISANRLLVGLRSRGLPVTAVVISDSFGRPWRMGVVNVAIGAAGFPSLVDHRGEQDRDGRKLEVTQIALADMAASAAGLAMGEGKESVPVVLMRGLALNPEICPVSALVRPIDEDLFQ